MRKALSVSVLILALTCPVLAGIMPNGVTQPPPQQQPAVVEQEPTTDGQTPDAAEAPSSLSQTILHLLDNLLALL